MKSLIKSLKESLLCFNKIKLIFEATRSGVIPIILRKNFEVYEDNLLLLKNINSSSLIFKK